MGDSRSHLRAMSLDKCSPGRNLKPRAPRKSSKLIATPLHEPVSQPLEATKRPRRRHACKQLVVAGELCAAGDTAGAIRMFRAIGEPEQPRRGRLCSPNSSNPASRSSRPRKSWLLGDTPAGQEGSNGSSWVGLSLGGCEGAERALDLDDLKHVGEQAREQA